MQTGIDSKKDNNIVSRIIPDFITGALVMSPSAGVLWPEGKTGSVWTSLKRSFATRRGWEINAAFGVVFAAVMIPVRAVTQRLFGDNAHDDKSAADAVGTFDKDVSSPERADASFAKREDKRRQVSADERGRT